MWQASVSHRLRRNRASGVRVVLALLLGTLVLGTQVMVSLGVAGPFTFATPAYADNRMVPDWPDAWQAPELRDHPLAGKIWSREKRGFVTAQEYGLKLATTRFVLLGEVHDNPDHHRLQAWAIHAISKLRGARIIEGAPQMDVVAMEMLTADEQPALDRFYGRKARVPRARTSADFGRLMKWDTLGWPAYEIYQPIITQSLNAHLVIIPASPARAENRKVSKEGMGALAHATTERLGLARALAPDLSKALGEEIRESHCGMLPDTAVPNMSVVQRLRDASMADAMLGSPWKGAILIAGNGHVRRDRAVPWYLDARGIGAKDIAVVRHVEVEAGKSAVEDYGLGPAGEAAELADFVIFTPRQPRNAPCDEMRRQMEAIKAKRKAQEKPAREAPPSSAASPPGR